MLSNEQTLTKAIEKAIENGWDFHDTLFCHGNTKNPLTEWWWNDTHRLFEQGEWETHSTVDLNTVIFSHDFAKALWGEEATYDMTHIVQPDNSYKMNVRPAWKVHLQSMVVAEDPIAYLGENL